MMPTPAAQLTAPHGRVAPSAVDALARAVNAEVRLLEDLIGVMRKQRASVAADDLQGVDDSVFATHRILVTLGEARRQRRSLGKLLGGSDDIGLRALEDVLGDQMSEELSHARDGLRAAALTLSREVETNRRLLRSALATGSEMMLGLTGTVEPESVYRPESRSTEKAAAGGLLIDRQV